MRRDRGEGVPVPLAPRGRQESARHRREVEVSLDHGDTEDSDDQLSGNDEETGNDMNMSTLYSDIICRPFMHTYMVLLRCCSQSCKLAAETQGYMLLSLFPRPNITTLTFRPEPQGLTAMIACIACCKSIASCSSWGGRRLGCILVFRT